MPRKRTCNHAQASAGTQGVPRPEDVKEAASEASMNDDPVLRQLLMAILVNRGEDEPRLQFADRCRELGREVRAEFIELSVRAERSPACRNCSLTRVCDPECPDDTCRWNIKGRAQAVIQSQRNSHWLGPATTEAVVFGSLRPEDAARGLVWRRGFLAELTCDSRSWINWGDEILREQPVEKVSLPDFHPHLHCDRWTDGGSRLCSLVGRMKVHRIPWRNASRRHYQQVLANEWPPVKFLTPIHQDPS